MQEKSLSYPAYTRNEKTEKNMKKWESAARESNLGTYLLFEKILRTK